MKKLLIFIVTFSSLTTFAQDVLKGSVVLHGVNTIVNIETNVMRAKNIQLGNQSFSISSINEGNISASHGSASLSIYIGEEVRAGLGKMSTAQMVDYFRITNGSELKCVKNKSKGFLVLSTDFSTVGNCIN